MVFLNLNNIAQSFEVLFKCKCMLNVQFASASKTPKYFFLVNSFIDWFDLKRNEREFHDRREKSFFFSINILDDE